MARSASDVWHLLPAADRFKAAEKALEKLRSTGERGSLRKEMEERHKRELRRLRTDELRSGLVALSAVYRDRLVSEQGGTRLLRSCVDATEAITAPLTPERTLGG